MTIHHFKLWLRQDADLLAVAEIVRAYPGAILDDDDFIVYFNSEPAKVSALASELLSFRYKSELTIENF